MAAFVETLLDRFHERTPIRAGSLIVTVFGDAVVPRGGVLSLTTLHEIMRAFRISDTLVRTALSRLVSEGWFERWKVGRNSYYRLTPQGHEAFAEATQRIYTDPPQNWQGSFDLLLLENAQDRSALRAELSAAGYGSLGPDLLLAAAASGGKTGPFLRLAASPADLPTARRLVERAWPLADIESRYRRFIDTYAGILGALERGAGFTNLDALLVRILLIHDYRRAVLKDPLLPAQLLPRPWAGTAARALCGTIYRTVLPAAEHWIDAHAQNDVGPLPAVDRDFRQRFASLEPSAELKIG
ncbi:phenylacetic acid degradation operon negative regulatory protein PaaX [Microvirga sp. 3-52]|jgi:phenylacetic acid degradation operon negative regulatory protein|uniref:PaaX family transcriptional regulator C-terminal domain-containing protein n=1 Tax=Microvirga sp. 3-52 TaxID=2792425 RepID=UPI001AC479EC|nr:PaaX family transcriptional regulator C-terminal domain-containing protein [Microvirga sp. 3-52]MBO1904375.1 phenylacetic acid degradation operon negative regulatory protein PaaX [Microvirga sp. 3-52]MBS7451454.1 phenylacetic acid degradation operon negative regulatory protein PaaX [Microvirga sp. 3-52]